MTFTLYGPLGPATRVERWGLAVALVLCAALMWPLRGYLTDDTFIHLQYARHLSQGQGLVFNAGERVYGCTSPLWVSLIADGMALGFDGIVTAKVLGGLATLWSVTLFFQLMRRNVRTPAVRATATVAWACHAWMLRWSLSGMETPLAVALTLAGFVAFTEGMQWGSRPVRTGALWALAALTRPEAALLLLLWGIFLVVDTDSRPGLRRLVAGALPPAMIYGAWLLFARFYFGTFWPQTLSAKSAGGGGLAVQLDNLWRQARIVAATDGVLVGLLVLALAIGGRRLWPDRIRAQRLLPWAWVIAVPMLYVARGVPVLSRYLLPLMPVVAWLAWRAAECWSLGRETTPRRSARTAAIGAALAVLVIAQNLFVYRTVVVPQVTSFTAGLEQSLSRWGRWFARETPPGTRIATPDIGAIGYYSRRPVVDLAGLVTPAIVPLLEREPQETMIAQLRFADVARPAYLMDRAPRAWDLLLRSPYAACLAPIGHASVPNLGVARPGRAVYSIYRVDWARYEAIHAAAGPADSSTTPP